MENKFDVLQKKIGLNFKKKDILINAFIHRSFLNEHRNFKGNSNERLEFLGDAVLSLIVSSFLYEKLPENAEGQLTTLRASLVRTETLAKIASSLSLGDYLTLSKGEEETGGRNNPTILANTYEALVGAIYLDLGIESTGNFIKKTVLTKWRTLIKSAVYDHKSKLQEVLQHKYHKSPVYKLITSWGPDHARKFRIGVYLNEDSLGEGEGKSKQEAAQNAAQQAIKNIKQKV